MAGKVINPMVNIIIIHAIIEIMNCETIHNYRERLGLVETAAAFIM